MKLDNLFKAIVECPTKIFHNNQVQGPKKIQNDFQHAYILCFVELGNLTVLFLTFIYSHSHTILHSCYIVTFFKNYVCKQILRNTTNYKTKLESDKFLWDDFQARLIADHIFLAPEIIYSIIIMAPSPQQKWKTKKKLLK